jgi:diaminohydroxyphosphoribosylaminopyrimidine deaminase / 5-amino-6-(5-phosphoribosylamino)uracil reductase
VPIVPLLEEFGQRGMTSILVEGGGQVLGSFLDEHQLDEVDVYVAPIIEGGDHDNIPVRGKGSTAMNDALRLSSSEMTRVGVDMRVRGSLPQPWRVRAGFGAG